MAASFAVVGIERARELLGPAMRFLEGQFPASLFVNSLSQQLNQRVKLKRLSNVGHYLRNSKEPRTGFLAVGAHDHQLSCGPNSLRFGSEYETVRTGYRQIEQNHIEPVLRVAQQIHRPGSVAGFDDLKSAPSKPFCNGHAEYVFVFNQQHTLCAGCTPCARRAALGGKHLPHLRCASSPDGRKEDLKRRSLSRRTDEPDDSPVRAHDALHHSQTQTSACEFRCEERVERSRSFVFSHPAPGIGNQQTHARFTRTNVQRIIWSPACTPTHLGSCDGYRSGLILYGLRGVDNQIHNDLPEMGRMPLNRA